MEGCEGVGVWWSGGVWWRACDGEVCVMERVVWWREVWWRGVRVMDGGVGEIIILYHTCAHTFKTHTHTNTPTHRHTHTPIHSTNTLTILRFIFCVCFFSPFFVVRCACVCVCMCVCRCVCVCVCVSFWPCVWQWQPLKQDSAIILLNWIWETHEIESFPQATNIKRLRNIEPLLQLFRLYHLINV